MPHNLQFFNRALSDALLSGICAIQNYCDFKPAWTPCLPPFPSPVNLLWICNCLKGGNFLKLMSLTLAIQWPLYRISTERQLGDGTQI